MQLCSLHSASTRFHTSRPVHAARSPAFVQKLQARSRQQYKRAQKRLSASQAENISPTSDGADPSPNSDVKSYHANAGLKIHQASSADAQAIASLCSEVFGPLTFRGFPAFMKASETLQRQAKFEISKDVDTQLRRAMDAKQKARLEAREYRVIRMNSLMHAELQKLAGLPSRGPDAPNPMQRQALKRWQRSRHFICLVATENESGEKASGCVVLSMAAPEALLPPPFPSRAPLRCCVSNLAVAEGLRRRGVAKKLLKRCESIARRWGHGELWLHADANNAAAVQLYRAVGYQEVKRDPSLIGPFQRILFRKKLEKLQIQDAAGELLPGRSDQGTYLWDISSK